LIGDYLTFIKDKDKDKDVTLKKSKHSLF